MPVYSAPTGRNISAQGKRIRASLDKEIQRWCEPEGRNRLADFYTRQCRVSHLMSCPPSAPEVARSFAVEIAQWKIIQADLAARRVEQAWTRLPRFVAGADVAMHLDETRVVAAAVVYDRLKRQIIETASATAPAEFPYLPGYLSFREGPALLAAIARLQHPWELLLVDGQGYAHPRRCGIALHIGVSLDRPSIGVGKSRLCGQFQTPGPQPGNASALRLENEKIGLVLRTKLRVNPLFISVGHRVTLAFARKLVLSCCNGYRLPEPTRQADHLTKLLRRDVRL